MFQGYGGRRRGYIGGNGNFYLFGNGEGLFLFFNVALFRDRKIGAALLKKIFFYRVDTRRAQDVANPRLVRSTGDVESVFGKAVNSVLGNAGDHLVRGFLVQSGILDHPQTGKRIHKTLYRKRKTALRVPVGLVAELEFLRQKNLLGANNRSGVGGVLGFQESRHSPSYAFFIRKPPLLLFPPSGKPLATGIYGYACDVDIMQ